MHSLGRQFWRLARDVASQGGFRFWAVALLGVAAGLVESSGLMLLPTLLRLLGLQGDISPSPSFTEIGRWLGLEGALLAYLLLAAAGGGIVYVHAVAVQGLIHDYGDCQRRQLHQAILGMGCGSPPLRRPADLLHALTQESNQAAFTVRQFLYLLSNIAQLPTLLFAALMLSWPFTLMASALSVALLVGLSPLGKRAYALSSALMDANRQVHAELTDQIAGFRTVKILGAEKACAAELAAQLQHLRQAQMSRTRAQTLGSQIQRLGIALAAALAVWIGLKWQKVPLAELLVLILVFGRMMMVIGRLQEQGRQVLQLLPLHISLKMRQEDCLKAAEPIINPAASPSLHLRQDIRLERLTYAPPGEPAIIEDMTTVIPAGSMTALVGPSGAGKSTLADLLMGLTAPTSGRLLVDDAPLEGSARLAWRARVAYVPQDCFLFNDSLRANLRLAAPAADDTALWQALERSAIADKIRELPDGLDTLAGDRGQRFSGGERQRILLARALLQKADLLVLDEATSALDEASETQVLASLEGLRGQVTMVVISHRPRIVEMADKIIRLEEKQM